MGIVDNKKLRFVKKSFNSIDDAKAYATNGRMVFDSAHKVICVDGEMYGGVGETGGKTPVFMSSPDFEPWSMQTDEEVGGIVASTSIFGRQSAWDKTITPGSNQDSIESVPSEYIIDECNTNSMLVDGPEFKSNEYIKYMPAFIILTGDPEGETGASLDVPAAFLTDGDFWYVCSFDNIKQEAGRGTKRALSPVPVNLLAGDRVIFGMFMTDGEEHRIFLVLSKVEAILPGEGISILNPESPLANVIELDLATDTLKGGIRTGHSTNSNLATGLKTAVKLEEEGNVEGRAYVEVGKASSTKYGMVKLGYQESGDGRDMAVQAQGGTNKLFIQGVQASSNRYGMIKTSHPEPLNKSEKSVQLDSQGRAFITPGIKSKDQYGEGRIGFTSLNPALKPVRLDPNNREYVDIADHCEYELMSGPLGIVKAMNRDNAKLIVYKCRNTYDGAEYLVTDMKDYGAIAHNYSVGLTGIQGGHTYGFAYFNATAGKLAFKIHLRPNGSSENEFVYPFAMVFDTPTDTTYAFVSGLEWKFRIFGTFSELWTTIEVPESFNGDIYITDIRYTLVSGTNFGLLYSNNGLLARQGVYSSSMSASVERPALNADSLISGWTEWTADNNDLNLHTDSGYTTLNLTKEQLIPLPVDIIYDGDIAFASADLHTTFFYGCGAGRDISVVPDNQFTGWSGDAPTYDAGVADSEERRISEMTLVATGTVNGLRPTAQGVDEVAQIEGTTVDARYENPTKTAGDIVAYSDVTIGNLKISRGQKIPAGNFLENIIRKMITAVIYPSPATAPKITSVTSSTTTYTPIVSKSTDTSYRSVTTKKFTMSYSNGVFDPQNWCEQTQPSPNTTFTPVMSATGKVGFEIVPDNGTTSLAAVTTKIALGQNKYTVNAKLTYSAPSNRPIRNDGAAANVTGDANDHTIATSNSSVWAAGNVTNSSSYYQTYGLMPIFTNYATGADAASATIKGQPEYVLAYTSGASATTTMNTTARNPNNTSNRIVFRIPAGNGSVSCWWWVPGTVSGVHFWNSLTQVWENTASSVTQEHVVLTFAGRNWKYTLVKIKAKDHAAADWRITLGTNFHADPGNSW